MLLCALPLHLVIFLSFSLTLDTIQFPFNTPPPANTRSAHIHNRICSAFPSILGWIGAWLNEIFFSALLWTRFKILLKISNNNSVEVHIPI